MTDDRDLQRLLASPYDDGDALPSGGRGRVRWIVPLLAVVAGAGLAYAMTAPAVAETETATTVSSAPATTVAASGVEYVRSASFPEGFVPVSETVAVSPMAIYQIDGRTYVTLGVSVRGGVDPLTEPFPSFARWELLSPGGQHTMVGQTADSAAPAFIEVGFDGDVDPAGAVVSAYVATSESSTRVVIQDDAPRDQIIDTPFEIDVEGTSILIERLNYNDDWGYVRWDSPDRIPATVEIIVSYLGTEDEDMGSDLPVRVITFGSAEVFLGVEGDLDISLWTVGSQSRMDRSGPFRFDHDLISRVTVEAAVSLALSEASAVELPLDLLADSGF
jgi:hypothetical protein